MCLRVSEKERIRGRERERKREKERKKGDMEAKNVFKRER